MAHPARHPETSHANRIWRILLTPQSEWRRIKDEPFLSDQIYTYIAVLSSIPPIAKMMGVFIFGYPGPMGTRFRPPFASVIGDALVEYVLILAAVFILVLTISILSPLFGSRKNRLASIKLVAYSGTAFWLSGVFSFVPGLGVLRLLGLYSVYLLFRGLPVLLETPKDRVAPFAFLIGVFGLVLCLAIKAVTL